MKTHLTRQAKTRRDSGELTRDQKRQRERNAIIEEVMEPGKWYHRGVQPAVAPRPSANPAAIAESTLDPRERHSRELCAEVVATFGGVTADLDEPECWGRREWLAFHARLLICSRRSMQWLTTSRRFGAERWGETFVDDAEDNPPHARRHAQEPRSAVAMLDACHGARREAASPPPPRLPPHRGIKESVSRLTKAGLGRGVPFPCGTTSKSLPPYGFKRLFEFAATS